jgi:malate dehydrogenase (oxaloacetate-decarboxylating)(NADP+)
LDTGSFFMKSLKQDALDYHRTGRKGKIEVVATKPCRTQAELSLAYTPGVAEPCREIARSPELSMSTPQGETWSR